LNQSVSNQKPIMEKGRSAIIRALSVFCLLLLWHLWAAYGWLDIPGPGKTFAMFYSLLVRGDPVYERSLIQLAMASLRTVILGSLLAFLLAVPLGLLIGWSRDIKDFLNTLLELLRPIPPLAWIPLAYILFAKSGNATFHVQIFIVFLGAFFPTLVNTIHGVRAIETIYFDAAKTIGARPVQILRKVVIPASLPSIFTGMRIGLGIGWMCIVAAEFVGGKMGLGFYIWASYTVGGKGAEILSGMIAIGLIGYAMNRGLLELEKKFLPWHSA
jgi:NitT/TauT family transport system permease protein